MAWGGPGLGDANGQEVVMEKIPSPGTAAEGLQKIILEAKGEEVVIEKIPSPGTAAEGSVDLLPRNKLTATWYCMGATLLKKHATDKYLFGRPLRGI